MLQLIHDDHRSNACLHVNDIDRFLLDFVSSRSC